MRNNPDVIQQRNVVAEDLVRLVRQLHRHLRGRLIVVWDQSGPHRAAARRLLSQCKWVRIEWLPAYAPELNPCEQCWNRAKYVDLANFSPADVEELSQAVAESIVNQRTDSRVLHSFFARAGLSL